MLLVARPARGVAGGDLYCLHSCGDRTLIKVVLVDVTGHGERSAAVAKAVHRLLHRHSEDTQPSRLLDLVNRKYPLFVPLGVLATSLCAVYDSRRSKLHYAYGGQPGILLWQAQQRQWTSLAALSESICGLPFGVTVGGCYEDQSVSLQPEDTILIFSDGILEMRSRNGTLFQSEGVLRLARECSAAISPAFPLATVADNFLRKLQDFNGGPNFQDDLTLLWARRLPAVGPVPAVAKGI